MAATRSRRRRLRIAVGASGWSGCVFGLGVLGVCGVLVASLLHLAAADVRDGLGPAWWESVVSWALVVALLGGAAWWCAHLGFILVSVSVAASRVWLDGAVLVRRRGVRRSERFELAAADVALTPGLVLLLVTDPRGVATTELFVGRGPGSAADVAALAEALDTDDAPAVHRAIAGHLRAVATGQQPPVLPAGATREGRTAATVPAQTAFPLRGVLAGVAVVSLAYVGLAISQEARIRADPVVVTGVVADTGPPGRYEARQAVEIDTPAGTTRVRVHVLRWLPAGERVTVVHAAGDPQDARLVDGRARGAWALAFLLIGGSALFGLYRVHGRGRGRPQRQ
ncbi:hypothetical protein [Kineosporia sp. A_224]|uniref:hypothetical protein n=1 Tax=Kineosporia sp. A_224 TaxID=1962180 RepID=UPI000B4BA36C|nr:hypothetical protein [Kineosporia sp. A_224]